LRHADNPKHILQYTIGDVRNSLCLRVRHDDNHYDDTDCDSMGPVCIQQQVVVVHTGKPVVAQAGNILVVLAAHILQPVDDVDDDNSRLALLLWSRST